jgi:hydroxypyruvate isomerase
LDYQASHQDKETPLTLLEASLRKLNHADMQVGAIAVADFNKARQLAADIHKRAKEIECEIYHAQKEHASLATKR